MCIAVVKPSGIEMPSQQILMNCFISNPHGAGFMYVRDGLVTIKKGFMYFKDFYEALCKEDLKKEDVVFLHFRIATHGLRDGGNTHPFPISFKTSDLRKTDHSFSGFAMIHNGIFHYPKKLFYERDKTGVISDTMLFSKLLYDEAYVNVGKRQRQSQRYDDALFDSLYRQVFGGRLESLLEYDHEKNIEKMIWQTIRGEKDNYEKIKRVLGMNKVAILSPAGEAFIFGRWIKDGGVLYSNDNYAVLGPNRSKKPIFQKSEVCCICNGECTKGGGVSYKSKFFCWKCFSEYAVIDTPIESQFFTCTECKKTKHISIKSFVNEDVCLDCDKVLEGKPKDLS